MAKYIALTSFDEKDNLVIEVFKYNLFRTRLKRLKGRTIVLREQLKQHYCNEHTFQI